MTGSQRHEMGRWLILLPMLLLVLGSVEKVEGSKIFFMIPLTTISEKNVYVPLIDALGKRGHEVTVVSIKKSNYESKNVKEFTTIDSKDFLGDYSDPKQNRQQGRFFMYTYTHEWNTEACHKVFQNEEFMRAIKQQYDLVFTNYWFQHCFAGILYLQQVPFIMVNTMPPFPYVFELTGYKLPMSIVPHPLMTTTANMNFLERVENTIFDFYWTIFTKYSYIPASQQVYRHYLGQHLPDGYQIESNVSLIFSNSHFTLNAPSPTSPEIVEIGGLHCQDAKPLPKDLEEFLSGARDGFIYFSLGTIVKAKAMPKEWVDIFIAVFSKLKQRVLFKWEDDNVPNFPPNVMTRKWMPQQDILGHKNIRLFISHGGGLSTQEALFHGVPIVGFPIMVDQDLNMRNAEERGFAKMLEILELSEESLGNAINDVLHDPKYARNAKRLSTLFRDQQETPLQRAIYYTEYAIRHKGTAHMRSPGRDLTFYQYYLWDVLAFIFVIFILLMTTIVLTFKFLYRLIFNKGKSTNLKKKQR